MPLRIFKDNSRSFLFSDLPAASTIVFIRPQDSDTFPQPVAGQEFFSVTVEDRRTGQIEICHCLARNGPELHCLRGQEGTIPQFFVKDSIVSHRLTAESLTEIHEEIEGFTDTYLGVHSAPPATGNHGEPLVDGMLYVDSTTGFLYFFLDGTWRLSATDVSSLLGIYNYVIAAGGSSEVSGPDINSNTPLFEVDLEYVVSVNGLEIVRDVGNGGDYTVEQTNARILFVTPLVEDDEVAVHEHFDGTQIANPVGVSIQIIDDISAGFNGVTTSFALTVLGGSPIDTFSPATLFLNIDGTYQRPVDDYILSPPDTVVFTDPPVATSVFSGLWLQGVPGTGNSDVPPTLDRDWTWKWLLDGTSTAFEASHTHELREFETSGGLTVRPYWIDQIVWRLDGGSTTLLKAVVDVPTGSSFNENDWAVVGNVDVGADRTATGLLEGGQLTHNGVLTLDIAAGKGLITNPTTLLTAPIGWSVKNGYVIQSTPSSTEFVIFIAINSVGDVVESVGALTGEYIRDNIVLGSVFLNNTQTDILVAPNKPLPALTGAQSFIDHSLAQGPFSLSGGLLSANGANLSLDMTDMEVWDFGSNFHNDKDNPDRSTIPGGTPVAISTFLGTGELITFQGAFLDPTMWDDNGTLTAVGGAASNTTNQFIFAFSGGNVIALFGQRIHDNLEEAIESRADDLFTLTTTTWIDQFAILVGVVTMTRVAMDLTDPMEASIGSSSGLTGPGGGSVDISALQATNTGVTSGGEISSGAGALDVTIADGNGVIIDAYTTPGVAAKNNVIWSGLTDVAINEAAFPNDSNIYLSIDVAGALVQQGTPPTSIERRTRIFLGDVTIDLARTGLRGINSAPLVAFALADDVIDFYAGTGATRKIDGFIPSANGANLSIDISAGELFGLGINWHTSKPTPNFLTVAGDALIDFDRYVFSGGGVPIASGATTVDPANLDDGAGGITAVGGGQSSSTNQYIYEFLAQPDNLHVVFYGTVVYADLASAVNAAFLEHSSIDIPDEVLTTGFFIGVVSTIRGAIDLSDTAQGIFQTAATGGGGSGSGGTIIPDPLQLDNLDVLATSDLYALGLPGDTDTEFLRLDYSGTEYRLEPGLTGTGVLHPLSIGGTELIFKTGASPTLTEAMRIDSGRRVLVGHTANIPINSHTDPALSVDPILQIVGAGDQSRSTLSLVRFDASGLDSAGIIFGHSRNATIGVLTANIENDLLGVVAFAGVDTTPNMTNLSVRTLASVDGTVGVSIVPGRWSVETANSAGTLVEALRIDSSQNVGIDRTAPQSRLHIGSGSRGSFAFFGGDNGQPDEEVILASPTTNDAIGYQLSVTSANNVRAIFFLDDADNLFGLDASASSSAPDFVVRNIGSERLRIGSVGMTVASLAGAGSRTVVADANGLMSAP